MEHEQEIIYNIISTYLDEGLNTLKLLYDTTNETQRKVVKLLDSAENLYLARANKSLTADQLILMKEMLNTILSRVENPIEALEEILSLAPYVTTDQNQIKRDMLYLATKADKYKYSLLGYFVIVTLLRFKSYRTRVLMS